MPIGVSRGSDLLGINAVVINAGEKLLLRHIQIVQIYHFFIHIDHLSFVEKEILGSTMDISTSPRIIEMTDKKA